MIIQWVKDSQPEEDLEAKVPVEEKPKRKYNRKPKTEEVAEE